MTFDEADDIVTGAVCWDLTQDEYESFSEPVTRSAVKKVLSHLRETYAKPIKMTQAQYDYYVEVRNKGVAVTVAETCMWDLVDSVCEIWKPLTEEDVTRAWLHPELIEVDDYA